ncbi:MAG: DUF4167 domain-containing protein [Pseudomonadota bacterium]
MNNNRNNRRRGRGNRNQGGGGNQLNRIDSRARGNAPQLLDKYKKLAQDAQHNGDRVQAEYYLQFADHYFRVIADNKARQEEARAKRNEERDQANDDSDDNEDGDNRRNDNRRGGNRRSRGRRDEQEVAEGETGNEGEAIEIGQASEETEAPRRRARKPKDEAKSGEKGAGRKPRRKPREDRNGAAEGEKGGEIDSSVLPPAIGADGSSDSDGDDTLEAVG